MLLRTFLLALLVAWLPALEAGRPVGTPLLEQLDPTKPLNNGQAQYLDLSEEGRVLSITSAVRDVDWKVTFPFTINQPVQAGEAVLVSLEARCSATQDESQQSIASLELTVDGFHRLSEEAQDELNSLVTIVPVALGNSWTTVHLRAIVPTNQPAGTLVVLLRAGGERQTIQVRSCRIEAYPAARLNELPHTRPSYEGREAEAPWRAEAHQRIRQHRMRDVTLTGLTAGTMVEVELVRHAFAFDAAVQAFQLLPKHHPEAADYLARLDKTFTGLSFTNALKAKAWAGDWGARQGRATTMDALRVVAATGRTVRGHALVWPRRQSLPKSLVALLDDPATNPDSIRAHIDAHIADIAAATAGLVDEWDVLNESITCTDVQERCGDGIMVHWFQEAARRMPGVRLVLNDYGMLSSLTDTTKVLAVESRLRWLQEQGARVDLLGMQGHIGGTPPSPRRMMQVLDRFAPLVPGIRITEYDVKMKDPALIEDFTRDFYTLLFSRPEIAGIQMWDTLQFWNPDGSLAPVGRAYMSLVWSAWKTHVRRPADAQGTLAFAAFPGTYRLTANGTTRTLVIPVGTGPVRLAVHAP